MYGEQYISAEKYYSGDLNIIINLMTQFDGFLIATDNMKNKISNPTILILCSHKVGLLISTF